MGDDVLVDNISELVRRYVTCIGRLYNDVGFHSFEHCVHVTLSIINGEREYETWILTKESNGGTQQ